MGLGPVGLLAASLLADRGLTVLGVDAAPRAPGLPRAATTDGEALRVLQAVGVADDVRARATAHDRVELADRRGRIHVVQEGLPRPHGHPALVSLSQADLDDVLLQAAARRPGVELRRGCRLVGIEATEPEAVAARLEPGGRIRARALLGCDGARSTVRRALGIPFRGRTPARPWLVLDVGLRGAVDLPPAVRFLGEPRRPGVMLPLGPGLRRWEWRLAPGERPDPRRLLAPWLELRDHELVRCAVYGYHARLAGRWRQGRAFLLGDAAHLMPPFAGQGLSTGLRDAHDLCWKLAEVLAGAAPEALLDSYQAERRRPVRASLALALGWGAVVQARRPGVAALRDAALAALAASPLAPALRAGAGLRPPSPLLPQPDVRLPGGRTARLDDALGPGWATLGVGVPPAMGARGRAVELAPRGTAAREGRWELLDEALDPWRGREVVLRPDRVPASARC